MKKCAFTLIEMLVVLSIIGNLGALLFPVFSRARENARRTACLSNLKQIGLAVAFYRNDFDGYFPRYRVCPDTPADPFCLEADPPVSTGPREMWWAPFDTDFAPDAQPLQKAGLLSPYVQSSQIWTCPSETRWQIGYAMSYVSRGPSGKHESQVTNSGALFAWDHTQTPGCAHAPTPRVPGTPWLPVPRDVPDVDSHYPKRHNGGFNVLRVDGGAKWRTAGSLRDEEFWAN